MSAGDPGKGDFDDELMAMAQQLEERDNVLMDTEKQCPKEKEHSHTNPPTTETGESKIQELSDEETETSTKEPITKNSNEDYENEKDKDGFEPNSVNGGDSSNISCTQALSQTGEKAFPKELDVTAFSFNTKKEESLQKGNRKINKPENNPMLLSPVIRCVLKFLNIEDIKNCRLVCREWGSIGKPALASRALIRFNKYGKAKERKPKRLHECETPEEPKRGPVDFQSCFPDSTSNFSAFKITGVVRNVSVSNSWTIEELTKFFDAQQKYIKELKLYLTSDENLVKKIDLGAWISKSPMVLKDTKHLTKLTIEGGGNILEIPPLHLFAHTKVVTLSNCSIHVEAGIQISPDKLKLANATFYQDGIILDRVRINDIVDLGETKEISLQYGNSTKYVLDVYGSATLEKLDLKGDGVEIVNWETSQWVIEFLAVTDIPYSSISMKSTVNIKELYLNIAETIDLSTLPTSIQNLVLPNVNSELKLCCSEPTVLQNLQYLQIVDTDSDFSFLSHFMNCPKLAHLKFYDCRNCNLNMKSQWMPKTIKTLTLTDCCGLNWLGEHSEHCWNLETLVIDCFPFVEQLSPTNIQVEHFIVYHRDMSVDKRLGDFLDYGRRLGYGEKIYIGEIKWDGQKIDENSFKKYFDVKSSFYIFQDGQKGRPLSEKAFHELIPKHLDALQYL